MSFHSENNLGLNCEHNNEYVECQLGHLMEVNHRIRRSSWNQHHNFHFEHSSGNKSINDLQSDYHDLSVVSKSELYHNSGTSWFAAVFIMANCTIGMGLLNFPSAILRSGGIIPALIVLFIVLIFIVISLILITFLSRYYGDVTYQSFIGSHLGLYPRLIARLFICLNNFGALVIFLVVIGDQIEKVTLGIWSHSNEIPFILHRRILMPLIAAICIFPFCLLKRFDIFKYTSFIGVLAAAYVSFGLITTRYFYPRPSLTSIKKMNSEPNIFKIIPLLCMAFECHIECPPMITCLKKHNLIYCFKMIASYLVVSTVVYIAGGVFGYLSFGAETPDDILLGYDSHDILVIIAFILLTMKIITTYPVVFFCIRVVIEDILKRPLMRYLNEFFFRFFISLMIFIPSVLIAIFVPTISAVINLVGGISAVFIFIFPGCCFLKLYLLDTSVQGTCLAVFSIIYVSIGVFLSCSTTGDAILEFLR